MAMKKILLLSIFACSLFAHVQGQCNAKFTYTVNNNIVNFISADTAIQGVSIWYPGDGSVNFGNFLSYAYYASGTYTAKHIVMDSTTNCLDSSVQSISVQFTPSCSASFYYNVDSLSLGHYSFFDNSTIIGALQKTIQWTVNDSLAGEFESFNYAFPQAGTYRVCEQLTTTSGCVSSSCQDISVSKIDSCNLNAAFSYYGQQSNPLEIHFSTTIDNGANISYHWYFGDGVSDTAKNPVHIYVKGVYSASLFLEKLFLNTEDSCTSYFSEPVYVNIGPADTCSINFTYASNAGKPNLISFTENSGQPMVSQEWTIYKGWDTLSLYSGPLAYLQSNNPTYTFTDSGSYFVTLKTTTQSGCIDSTSAHIFIDSVSANTASPNSISQLPAYPNPATNSVKLNVPLTASNNIIVNIYSAMGNLIITKQVAGLTGNNQITIPVQSLQSGVYYLEINYGNQVKRSQFQKL